MLALHRPAGSGQHRRYPAIPVAAILGGERDEVGGESRVVIARRGNLALRGPMRASECERLQCVDSATGIR